MKNQIENPNGLHQKYAIRKIVVSKNPNFGLPPTISTYGKRKVDNEFIIKEVDVDKNAEYFVLRLDTDSKDINHIKACRIAINSYALAIKEYIPQLSADLIEKYPLL